MDVSPDMTASAMRRFRRWLRRWRRTTPRFLAIDLPRAGQRSGDTVEGASLVLGPSLAGVTRAARAKGRRMAVARVVEIIEPESDQ